MSGLEELASKLSAASSSPWLFIGAGVSRRYMQTDSWVELLEQLAEPTGRPYAYFASRAGSDLAQVATEIAVPFHEAWWSDDRFKESRAEWGDRLTTKEGPLKVEVARRVLRREDSMPTTGDLAAEVESLRGAVVDGVITTNYDRMVELLWPDFKVFVGESQLLFSDAQGVGEIYKIHGSADDPESIVLTAGDYERFAERNPYLAAKLATIFVEHPILFIGYSLDDANIRKILVSLARVLTTENLARLQDRLIFVRWDPARTSPTLVATPFAANDFVIPLQVLEVADYLGLFEVLASLRRTFPARILRQLKEEVYDLVVKTDSRTRLTVVDIEDATHAEDLEVVFGVGLRERLDNRGYAAISRKDLLCDVLRPVSDLEARRVVDVTLPDKLRSGGTTPVCRYLRESGLLRDDGSLVPDAGVDSRLAARVDQGRAEFHVYEGSLPRARRVMSEADGDFETMVAQVQPPDVLLGILMMPREDFPLELVREWLLQNAHLMDGPSTTTMWAKAVALYDYYKFGPLDLTPAKASKKPAKKKASRKK